MIVRSFYNPNAFPNTWMVVLNEGQVDHFKTNQEVSALFDKEGRLLGYNLDVLDLKLPSSKYAYIEVDELLLEQINKRLVVGGFDPLIQDYEIKTVVGNIVELTQHPKSQHLNICSVDIGDKVLQIVCGARNVDVNQKVVVCLEGCVLANGKLIVPGNLLGVQSEGMLASKKELGLKDDENRGIVVLDDTYEVGCVYKYTKEV